MHSPRALLWTFGLKHRSVQLAGLTMEYVFREREMAAEQMVTMTLPANVTLRPGEELRVEFSSARTPALTMGSLVRSMGDLADPAPDGLLRDHPRSGDTIQIRDPRGFVLASQMVHDRASPEDWINVWAWHVQTWLGAWVGRIATSFQAADLVSKASAMAYSSIMVLVPFVLLLLIAFTRAQEHQVGAALEHLIIQTVSAGSTDGSAARTASEYLEHFKSSQIGVGTMMFVFGVVSMALFWQSLAEHLNAIRGSPPATTAWHRRLLLNLFVFPGVVFFGYVAAHAIIEAVRTRDEIVASMRSWAAWLWVGRLSSAAVGWSFYGLVFASVVAIHFAFYCYGPSARPRARQALLGASVAAGLHLVCYLALGLLSDSQTMGLFGPVRFVPVVLLGFYLFWVVFFLGAYIALSDHGLASSDPIAEAVHIRFAILLALHEYGPLALDELAGLLGIDAARVWSQAYAMELAREEKRPAVLSVGSAGRVRIALDNKQAHDGDWPRLGFEAVTGRSDMLAKRVHLHPKISAKLVALLDRAARAAHVGEDPAARPS